MQRQPKQSDAIKTLMHTLQQGPESNGNVQHFWALSVQRQLLQQVAVAEQVNFAEISLLLGGVTVGIKSLTVNSEAHLSTFAAIETNSD